MDPCTLGRIGRLHPSHIINLELATVQHNWISSYLVSVYINQNYFTTNGVYSCDCMFVVNLLTEYYDIHRIEIIV